jgi:hypothetical protein
MADADIGTWQFALSIVKEIVPCANDIIRRLWKNHPWALIATCWILHAVFVFDCDPGVLLRSRWPLGLFPMPLAATILLAVRHSCPINTHTKRRLRRSFLYAGVLVLGFSTWYCYIGGWEAQLGQLLLLVVVLTTWTIVSCSDRPARRRILHSCCIVGADVLAVVVIAGCTFLPRRANYWTAPLYYFSVRGLDLSELHAPGRDLRNLDAAHGKLDLSKANLCGADLRHAHLENARLDGANLCGAKLDDARLGVMNGGTLSGATASRTRFESLHGVDVSGADLSMSYVTQPMLEVAHGDDETRPPPTMYVHCTCTVCNGEIPYAVRGGSVCRDAGMAKGAPCQCE